MNELLLQSFLSVLLSTALVAAVPLLLAALGETFAEQAGLLNLGLEGMMLSGAFAGFYATFNTNDPLIGLLVGLAVGLALGLVFGLLTISLRVNQVIIGLAITIFAMGITGFLFRDFYGTRFPTLGVAFPKMAIPGLNSIPVIGVAFFDHQLVVYLTWVLVVVSGFVLARTRFGLETRAVGENPFAADAAGVNVFLIRYLAIGIGGSLAGLAGAFLSCVDLSFFVPGMTMGQGFIAIAITMLGRWRPSRVFVGALLFGGLRSLSNGLQVVGVSLQPEFILMLPYLGLILAMVLLAGRTALPAALAIPYERGRQ